MDRTGVAALQDHPLQYGQNRCRRIARSSLAIWTEQVLAHCKIIPCNMDRTGVGALQDHPLQYGQNRSWRIARSSLAIWTEQVLAHCKIISCNMFWKHDENIKRLDAEVLVSNLHALFVTKSTSRINSENVKNK
jgi:hypothetical protein